MHFTADHPGPFNLSEPMLSQRKHPHPTGKKKKRTRNMSELLDILQNENNFKVQRRYFKKELHEIVKSYNISIEIEEDVIKEGWLGAPKGMLQLLYERKMIDVHNLNLYSLSGKKNQKDIAGNVLPQFQKYVLKKLMNDLTDFKEERTAMEVLFEDLSNLGSPSIHMLTSPKYHCGISGEGVELAWGFSKK